MGSVGGNTTKLIRDGNVIKSNADVDRNSIEWYLYNHELQPVSNKNGVEFGIVGTRRTRGRANNTNNGYVGYKIENGIVYTANFSPTSSSEAKKWVREAVKDNDYRWNTVGRL